MQTAYHSMFGRVMGTIASWSSSLRTLAPVGPRSSGSAEALVKPYGTRVVAVMLVGQGVSLIGSGLTAFALSVQVYRQTGSVTQMAAIALFASLPGIIFSPLAGVLVDRRDRRFVLMLSDAGAGLSTFSMVVLFFVGRLELWHICLAVAVRSLFAALQAPAFTATVTLLVPKRYLGRANGAAQFVVSGAHIVAPLLGGVLLGFITLGNIILIDVCTYGFALATLAMVRIPAPTAESGAVRRPLWRDVIYGWSYITVRPGLLALLLLGAFFNFVLTLGQVLLTPLVLSFSSAKVLGAIGSIGGIGVLSGSIIQGLWGGPRRVIHGVLGFGVFFGVCFACLGLRDSIPLIAFATFGMMLGIPIVSGCTQVIWQTKTPPAVQGRVFATRLMIGRSTVPLAQLIAGPLVDILFERLLMPQGPLSSSVGWLMGVGPGRGTGLLLVLLGTVAAIAPLLAYRYHHLRFIEDELP